MTKTGFLDVQFLGCITGHYLPIQPGDEHLAVRMVVAQVDGSGYFRDDRAQLAGLERYLKSVTQRSRPYQNQFELWQA